jgi:hypothetical protein
MPWTTFETFLRFIVFLAGKVFESKKKKLFKGIKVKLCVWSMCTHTYDVTFNYK